MAEAQNEDLIFAPFRPQLARLAPSPDSLASEMAKWRGIGTSKSTCYTSVAQQKNREKMRKVYRKSLFYTVLVLENCSPF